MEIVKNTSLDAKMFNFLRASKETTPEQRDIEGTNDGNGGGGGGSGGGGGGVGGKRKRDEEDQEDGHYTYTSSPSGKLRNGKRVTPDACPREGKT